ncbi:MAG TPA: hypothetical protein PKW06_02190, partial [Cyclobacteriaceae bacterium]|nr:hypothetical protein [Cyclobacteriaceae bacterium]
RWILSLGRVLQVPAKTIHKFATLEKPPLKPAIHHYLGLVVFSLLENEHYYRTVLNRSQG